MKWFWTKTADELRYKEHEEVRGRSGQRERVDTTEADVWRELIHSAVHRQNCNHKGFLSARKIWNICWLLPLLWGLLPNVCVQCVCVCVRAQPTHSSCRFPPHFWKVNTEIPDSEVTDPCQRNIQKPLLFLQRLFVFHAKLLFCFSSKDKTHNEKRH